MRTRLDASDGRRVLVTFDDGPDPAPDATPLILTELERSRARALFFCVGEQVQRAPQLAREIAARGHLVGLHGHRHLRPGALPDAGAELEQALAAFAAAGLPRPRLFRPPYGELTAPLSEAAAQLGLETIGWSAWGLDWEEIPAARIVELAARDLAPGAIVLLHDSARYAPRRSPRATAAAIAGICARARALGLEPELPPSLTGDG